MFGKIKESALAMLARLKGQLMPASKDDGLYTPVYDTSRYIHVSVPLVPVDPNLRKLLPTLLPYRKAHERGVPHTLGRNRTKRYADALAKEMGQGKKVARKLRRTMLARLEEVRAA